MSDINPDERFTFLEIARVIAENFGSTNAQSLTRAKKFVNRAIDRIVFPGHDKWSWLHGNDYLDTVASEEIYSLPQEVKKPFLFYLTGSNRQKLDRVPPRTFREYVPDPELYTGTPRLYDYVGRDSSGAIQIRFYPIPDSVYRVKFDFKKHVRHMQNDSDDVREFYNLPPDLLEGLIQMGTALSFKGIDDARYSEDMAEAEAMINAAYADDQEDVDTTIIAREIGSYSEASSGDPAFPVAFGR